MTTSYLKLPPEYKDKMVLLHSFFMLRNDKRFKPIVEHIDSCWKELAIKNQAAEGTQREWRQGAMQLLDELSKLIEKSGDKIDELDKANRQQAASGM